MQTKNLLLPVNHHIIKNMKWTSSCILERPLNLSIAIRNVLTYTVVFFLGLYQASTD